MRLGICPCITVLYIILLAVGLGGFAEMDSGSNIEWAPAGGRLEKQLKQVEKPTGFIDTSVQFKTAYIMVGPSDESVNILDNPKFWLEQLERVARRTHHRANMTYTTSDKCIQGTEACTQTYGWNDVCGTLNHPLVNIFAGSGEKPCIQPSPLDAFSEGAWQFEHLLTTTWLGMKTAGATACSLGLCDQIRSVEMNPSYKTLTNDQVVDRMKCNARHWLDSASQPIGKLYGGRTIVDGNLTHVSRLVMWLLHAIPDGPDSVVNFRSKLQDVNMTEAEYNDMNTKYLLTMEAEFEAIDKDEVEFPGVQVTFYPSDAMDRMYAEVASSGMALIIAGYAVMFVYTIISQVSMQKKYMGLMLVGAFGFIAVLLANLAAYGFIAMIGFKYNHTMVQALPFIALGLGVDDLFLLLHTARESMSSGTKTTDELVRKTMEHAGKSVTITSFCNAGVFFASCIVPIPALRAFLVAAGIIVLFNWLGAMTVMPCLISFWGSSVLKTSKVGDAAYQVEDEPAKVGMLSKCLDSMYSKLATSMPMQLGFFVVGLIFIAVTVAFIPSVDMGFEVNDIAKEGTYLGRGIVDTWDLVFSQHSNEYLMVGPGTNYGRDMQALVNVHANLSQSYWSAGSTQASATGVEVACPAPPPATGDPRCVDLTKNFWLTNFAICSSGLCEQGPEQCDEATFTRNFHDWRKPELYANEWSMPSGEGGSAAGGLGKLHFGSLIASLANQPNTWGYLTNNSDFTEDNLLMVSIDGIEIDVAKIKNTDDKIAMVKDLRKICDESGLNVFMYGWTYTQIEQFMDLEYFFWTALAVAITIIFFLCLILGFSWFSAFVTVVLCTCTCLQVYGCVDIFDMQFQALIAVSLLMSLGFAVEFVAHPFVAYDAATGTKAERLQEAMAKTAKPVLDGCLSSLVCNIFLAFSDFAYVRKYYCTVFVTIVVIGAINALILLPALIGMFGASKGQKYPNKSTASSSSSTY